MPSVRTASECSRCSGSGIVLGIILVLWLIGTPEFDSGKRSRTGRSSPRRGCSARAWPSAGSTSRPRGAAAFLEADRERKAHQAVIDERRRIAQELHDVVAHDERHRRAGRCRRARDRHEPGRGTEVAPPRSRRRAARRCRRCDGCSACSARRGRAGSADVRSEAGRCRGSDREGRSGGVPVTLRFEGDVISSSRRASG